MTYIYAACPIDQVRHLTPAGTDTPAQTLWKQLMGGGWDFDVVGIWWPFQENRKGEPHDPAVISARNQDRQRRSVGTLAYLPEGVPSLGVPVEIDRALRERLHPVAVIAHDGALASVQMHEWAAQGAYVTNSIDAAAHWLLARLRGERRISPAEDAARIRHPSNYRSDPLPQEVPTRWDGISWTPALDVAESDPLPNEADDGLPTLRFYLDEPEMRPTQAHPGDAGYDMYVSDDLKIGPNQSVNIPCGFEMDLPDGWWGFVTGRSSTLRKRGLLVINGIIDQGYRGPMFVTVQNLGSAWIGIARGERLAQIIPIPRFNGLIDVRPADHARSETSRGIAGFGSTGL